MMLASTPTSDYISIRSRAREASMSPSCRSSVQQHYHNNTPPPRLRAQRSTSYDSPMLTPSPLRRRPLFPNDHSGTAQEDEDIFLQSPFRSPQRGVSYPPLLTDDDEGGIFLAPQASPFPISSSQPLRTPVKQAPRMPSTSFLSAAPPPPQQQPLTLGGTKRKSTPLGSTSGDFSTPLRSRLVTPLGISSAQNVGDPNAGDHGVLFDRLAPLPAPRFVARTPQSKGDTDVHLKKHTETMTRLRICDLDSSDEEEDLEGAGDILFSHPASKASAKGKVKGKSKTASLGRALGASLLTMAKNGGKGNGNESEVAEAISPGGHITKRRARSRPVSQELLESEHLRHTPSPSPVAPARPRTMSRSGKPGPISFPSLTHRGIRPIGSPGSPTSPSEVGSPLPRRRISGHAQPRLPPPTPAPIFPTRAPMNRLTSSATLFFGPAIPNASPAAPSPARAPARTRSRSGGLRVNTHIPSLATSATANRRYARPAPSLADRHSYAGPGSPAHGGQLPWAHRLRGSSRFGSKSPSPRSCLSDGENTHIFDDEADEDDDMMFGGPQDSSFIFSVTEGTPSPRKQLSSGGLTTKYKPRDSGVVLSDDEGTSMEMHMSGGTMGSSASTATLSSSMPRASTSVNSVYSDLDQELVTPGAGPETGSGWPGALVIGGGGFEFDGDRSRGENEGGVDVDAFIRRTLAAGTKGPRGRRDSEGGDGYGAKKIPGTPKKMKTSHLGMGVNGDRPWQSAVAAKVAGFGLELDMPQRGNRPRKSMPAAFPRGGAGDTDSEGEEDSPSFRKEARYEGLGIGKPSGGGPFSKSRWLMRRSSSGIFSSGSDASISTPTKLKATPNWKPSATRIPRQFSPANVIKFSTERSVSGSSSSSVATLNSPCTHRQLPVTATPKPPSHARRRSQASPIKPTAEDDSASRRFERDFVEDDEVGSGEFGKVLKVRYKDGREGVFAVKKSKPFEGVRHRLRLREEVDILQHLSQAAAAKRVDGQHPNVLAYIDSWEQDDALYIQTELCELGNFARFLWEYGRAFPRLDEARVWKIFVDLSNGLQFIHASSVIHLDLKPANIFVTGEGRFKIGDFGMASLWPRPHYKSVGSFEGSGAFEREGDKVYLAPEVLQGKYGKEADIFSLGITMLETASNIVVPDQGHAWHQLRQEDFSQVDLDGSPELLALIKNMMRTDPSQRVDIQTICAHPVISRARSAMERTFATAKANGESPFIASPLASVPDSFLSEILGRPATMMLFDDGAMDLSP